MVASTRTHFNFAKKHCQRCKVKKTMPVCPEMAALPLGRVAAGVRAFSYCGIDLFGPNLVKIGRRQEKRWGVLCCCMTTRAIHLDVVASLCAKDVMMAMDNLAARRGCVVQYHSDCGTNFIAAAKQYVGPDGRRPKWRFNPPSTPHTGGAWERLVGLTMRALEGMEMERTPSPDRLRWFLCRAELLVNSRPLTEVTT